MTLWSDRSYEERTLLCPNFLAILLWHAAHGHMTEANRGLPVEMAFLLLPIVLPRTSRESLPRTITTSFVVWLDEHPLAKSQIAQRARALLPFTREALMFGGQHGILRLPKGTIVAQTEFMRSINSNRRSTSEEVASCEKKSEFVGRWLAKSGSSSTILALLGVRP